MAFRNKKNLLPFNKALDINLLKLVEEHRVLYDPSHPKYMDLDSREVSWRSIGEKLGKPANICKTRWVNIRDMMRRRLRDRMRNPMHRSYSYRYEEQLAFVIPFFKDSLAAEYPADGIEDTHLDMPAEVYLEEADYVNVNDDSDLKPTLCELTGLRDNTDSRNESFEDRLMEDIRPQNKEAFPESQVHFQELNSSDPIDVFLMAVGSTLRKFNPYYLNQAKSKIFQVVQDYELQQICNKDGNGNNANR